MEKNVEHKPTLTVVVGPQASGKTLVGTAILHRRGAPPTVMLAGPDATLENIQKHMGGHVVARAKLSTSSVIAVFQEYPDAAIMELADYVVQCGRPDEIKAASASTAGDQLPDHSGNKYVRRIMGRFPSNPDTLVDVYCVLDAFGVEGGPVAHATKKLLCPGKRGKGDRLQDLKDSIDALQRAVEMEERRTATP